MPTGNIAGDLHPRLFFSSPPPPTYQPPRGGERRSLLFTTLTDNSQTLTSGNNRPDNSRETSLEMLPENKKFWHRNHSYHRSLYTHNPAILLLLNNLLCSDFEVRHRRCVGSIAKNYLCITHTVEHNYIYSSITLGLQLNVSALYVGHLQVVAWLSEQLYKMYGVFF